MVTHRHSVSVVANESYSEQVQLDDIPTGAFTAIQDALLQEFTERFNDCNKILSALRLVASPHLVETEKRPCTATSKWNWWS
jgi:hypothetical protein